MRFFARGNCRACVRWRRANERYASAADSSVSKTTFGDADSASILRKSLFASLETASGLSSALVFKQSSRRAKFLSDHGL